MHDDNVTANTNAETKPELGYDHRDLPFGPIGKATFWFFLVTLITCVICYVIFMGFYNWKQGPQLRLNAKMQPMPKSPNPLLQTERTAALDIREMKDKDNYLVNQYQVVGQEKKHAKIPVNRAMELLAEKGLQPVVTGETEVQK